MVRVGKPLFPGGEHCDFSMLVFMNEFQCDRPTAEGMYLHIAPLSYFDRVACGLRFHAFLEVYAFRPICGCFHVEKERQE